MAENSNPKTEVAEDLEKENDKDNPDKEVVLSGNETENEYEIYPRKGAKLSLKKQFDVLDDIDRKYFLCLLDANADYRSFSKYLLKSETRSLASQLVVDEMSAPGAGIKK